MFRDYIVLSLPITQSRVEMTFELVVPTHYIVSLAHDGVLAFLCRCQGICFLGKLKFDEFLKHYLGESPGAVVDRNTGEIIGDHRGLWFHTIGQRKGVGPTLHPGNVHRGPWYVSGKHIGANVLEVTNRFESVDGPRESFQVRQSAATSYLLAPCKVLTLSHPSISTLGPPN